MSTTAMLRNQRMEAYTFYYKAVVMFSVSPGIQMHHGVSV